MQTPLRIEGWPALVTMDGACRYLSLNPPQFLALARKWKIYPVEIEPADDTQVWRRADLDRLIKFLPASPLLAEAPRPAPTVRLDTATLKDLARAVAAEIRTTEAVGTPAARQYVQVNEAAKQLCLGRSSIYRLIGEGKLEVRHLGRRTLILQASIDALLASA